MRNHFSTSEFTKLCTSLVYFRLYYCCELWLTPTLSKRLENRIDSLHNNILRLINQDFNKEIPIERLRSISKRATPREWANYAHARLLYQLLAIHEPPELFNEIAPFIYFERRYPHKPRLILDDNKRFSYNILHVRMHHVAKAINFHWFDNGTSFATFKSKAKHQFFSYLNSSK